MNEHSDITGLRSAAKCARCDGTGNELLAMYRCCSACGGSGTAPQQETSE